MTDRKNKNAKLNSFRFFLVSYTRPNMSISKTLPMKFKSMHYALLAFITQSDEIAPELKVGLIAKLPVLDSVENQINFYEKMVDFKTVEKDIVKPMMKKKKQEETKPVKEKKPRAPTKKTTADPVHTDPVHTDPVATVPVPVPTVIAEKPKKKRVVKKKAESPNPEQEEEKEKEEMNLTDEMKEEPYQPVTLTTPPTIKKTKVVAKKVTTAKPKAQAQAQAHAQAQAQATLKKADDEPEIEHWLIIRDGVRYWTTDEFEKNGSVYEYCIDSEGDGCSGDVAIGCLKDGKLMLN